MKKLNNYAYKSEGSANGAQKKVAIEQVVQAKAVGNQDDKKSEGLQFSKEEITSLISSMNTLLTRLVSDGAKSATLDTNVIARAIKDGIASANNSTLGRVRIYESNEIPTEDILETPAVFFSNKVMTAIFDDYKKGIPVQCPFGSIVFKPIARYQSPTDKNKIITQSMAVVWSKRQAEFVRNHTDFNILFFEKVSHYKDLSTDRLEKVAECYNTVKRYTEFEVQERCIKSGIKIDTDDFTELRKRLAYKMAETHILASEEFYNKQIEDMNEAIALKQSRELSPLEQTY